MMLAQIKQVGAHSLLKANALRLISRYQHRVLEHRVFDISRGADLERRTDTEMRLGAATTVGDIEANRAERRFNANANAHGIQKFIRGR